MNCLSCNGDLDGLKLDTAHIERCRECGGIWLDRGELDSLVDAEDEDVGWLELDLWKEAQRVSGDVSARSCPHGHGLLAALSYGDSGVQVDVCRTCGGVWLDAGEFENILDYLEEQAASISLPGYVRRSLQEARALVAGGKGRAEEWKDLKAVLRMLRLRLAVEHPAIDAVLKSLPR